MDIKDIKKEKRKLEKDILELLHSFEQHTRLQINNIEIYRGYFARPNSSELESIYLEIILP